MSEPENYVKKEEPRVSIKQRRKKSIGGILGTLFAENQSMLMLFAVIVAALAVILAGIIALHMPVVPVDIGIPLLAMHSARELMGAADQEALTELVKAYFSL